MSTVRRILVIGPSWVGDMMMAQSLFKLMKENNPRCSIDVLAPAWSLPLLAHMPEVSEAIISPFKHGEAGLRARYRLGKSLRERKYQQAIVLPNSFKSALVPYWAKIPLRTGFVGELRYGLLNDARTLNKTLLPKTVMRFYSLGLPADQPLPDQIPFPRLTTRNSEVAQTLADLKLAETRPPVLILCPGAEYGSAKQWPADHLAELACDRLKQHWQIWLLGSEKDNAICRLVNEKTDNRCINLAGKTELGQVIDLMSSASAVVSNDSGLMHIAAALDIPLVAIYGSSDPGFTPPLSNRVEIVSLHLSCSPCFKRTCPLGHLDCLNKLKPALVNSAIDSLLVDEAKHD